MPAAPARPNLRQIAQSLGLSVTTVSRALKDGPEVHPDTVVRVKAAAEAAGYVPNQMGLALRTGHTRTLAAILPLETRGYLSDLAKIPLIEGMTLAAQAQGYSLSIQSTLPEEPPLGALQRVVQSGAADGVIITRMTAADPRVGYLAGRGLAFATFGRSDAALEHAWVDIDNRAIAHEATALLLAEGHERIALQLLSRHDRASANRLAGHVAALAEAGREPDTALIADEEFTMAASESSVARMLDQARPPTALICANELGLLGALSALRQRGLRPGADVTLMTRDNTGICGFLSVPVRAHVVDIARVGQLLVEAVLAQLQDRAAAPRQHLLGAALTRIAGG